MKIGDSRFPYGPASGGSVTTGSLIPAVRAAAVHAREKLLDVASKVLEAPAGEVALGAGAFSANGKSAEFRKVCSRLPGETLVATGDRAKDYDGADTRLFGAQFAEVEVDIQTGQIKVLRVAAAHEIGRVLNRLTAESQVAGGVTQGLSAGLFEERVFRFREGQHNQFWWRNRIIAVPANLVQRRMNGDAYRRVDRITFRIPDMGAMGAFAKQLSDLVKANHRLQEDFRLDDVAARIRRRNSQGDVYDIIFLLSGVLALVGGGIVNVNIQMAGLKERVREVGVKMAIGASGREIFKGFMTEALLLTALGSLAGLALGVGFSWIITKSLGIPLYMTPASFLWAYGLAAAFGFLFALYPAWKASRLSPMEALRYE